MSDLLELGYGDLSRLVDPIDDLSSDVVSHLTLVAVRPELSPVDVVLPEASGDSFASQVVSTSPPCFHARLQPCLTDLSV